MTRRPARGTIEALVATELGAADAGRAGAAEAPGDWRPAWPRASAAERLVQGLVGAVLAAGLAVGLALAPSPTGTGTHTILGLPRCGMLVTTGHPCPTCGVTTSFVLAAHGRFGDALVNQPFGLVVFLLVVGGMLLAAATVVAGRSWILLLTPRRVAAAAVVLFVLAMVSWAYRWTVE